MLIILLVGLLLIVSSAYVFLRYASNDYLEERFYSEMKDYCRMDSFSEVCYLAYGFLIIFLIPFLAVLSK